jgi:hypothetical protein
MHSLAELKRLAFYIGAQAGTTIVVGGTWEVSSRQPQ